MTDSPYQLFALLDEVKEAALRASIQRFGVLVPVVQDQHGHLLDGHHRARIADDLGVKYRVDTITVSGPEEAREVAAQLNAVRRQLTPEERQPVVVDLHEHGHSNRAIAAALGVSEITVRRDLAGATYVAPDRIIGADGKSYPTTRPQAMSAPSLTYDPAPRDPRVPWPAFTAKQYSRLCCERFARYCPPSMVPTPEQVAALEPGDVVAIEYDEGDGTISTVIASMLRVSLHLDAWVFAVIASHRYHPHSTVTVHGADLPIIVCKSAHIAEIVAPGRQLAGLDKTECVRRIGNDSDTYMTNLERYLDTVTVDDIPELKKVAA